jgi:surface protein
MSELIYKTGNIEDTEIQVIKIITKEELRDVILLGKFDNSIQVKNTEHICSDGSIYDYSSITDTSNMFGIHYPDLISIPLIDTSNVTHMNNMFEDCFSLTSIPLFNTSKVIDLSFMFFGCSSLKNIPQFDITDNIINLSCMFFGCSSLKNIPQFDITDNIIDLTYMFFGCSSLKNIDKLMFYLQHIKEKDELLIKCLEQTPNSFSNNKLKELLKKFQ